MSARGFVAGCVVALAAFASAFAGERRLVWCASVYGEADESAYAADSWEKNAELLKSAGFTDLIVAVGRGNMAHYPSERLARSSAAEKGVFAACLAACRARGIKVHAWRVCYRMHDDPAAPEVKRLRDEGYVIVSVEQAEQSTSLSDFRAEPGRSYAFIFGNEVSGVRQDVVDASDICLEIPQYGTKHSLNVSVSIGIVLWGALNMNTIN